MSADHWTHTESDAGIYDDHHTLHPTRRQAAEDAGYDPADDYQGNLTPLDPETPWGRGFAAAVAEKRAQG